MKKKISVLLISLTLFLFCGCNLDSCYYGEPTVEGIKSHLAERYNLTFPDKVTMESYAANIFIDGRYCAILNYDGYDEEFNSLFTYEEKEIYKEYYNSDYACNYYRIDEMRRVTKNFSVPSLDNKYCWFSIRNDSSWCRMLYFYELKKLVIEIDWI